MILIPLYRSRYPSGIIFLLPEWLLLTFLIMQDWCCCIFPLWLQKSVCRLHFWKILLLGKNSGWPFFSCQSFQDSTSLSDNLHCFCHKAVSPIFVLLYIMCHFPHLWLLLRFFLYYWLLNNLIIMCVGVVFFLFIVFKTCWMSWTCGLIVIIKLKNFSAIIS